MGEQNGPEKVLLGSNRGGAEGSGGDASGGGRSRVLDIIGSLGSKLRAVTPE